MKLTLTSHCVTLSSWLLFLIVLININVESCQCIDGDLSDVTVMILLKRISRNNQQDATL